MAVTDLSMPRVDRVPAPANAHIRVPSPPAPVWLFTARSHRERAEAMAIDRWNNEGGRIHDVDADFEAGKRPRSSGLEG